MLNIHYIKLLIQSNNDTLIWKKIKSWEAVKKQEMLLNHRFLKIKFNEYNYFN